MAISNLASLLKAVNNYPNCTIKKSVRIIRFLDSSLKYNIINAKNRGVIKKEKSKIITYLTFYIGGINT